MYASKLVRWCMPLCVCVCVCVCVFVYLCGCVCARAFVCGAIVRELDVAFPMPPRTVYLFRVGLDDFLQIQACSMCVCVCVCVCVSVCM